MAGRPTLLTLELQAEAVRLARAGIPEKAIAERVRVHPATFCKWLKWGGEWEPRDGDECPEDREPYRAFREAFRHAQTDPVVVCEAVFLAAVNDKDTSAKDKAAIAEKWLKLHRQDLYRETVDLNVTGAVEVDAERILQALAEAQTVADRMDDNGGA